MPINASSPIFSNLTARIGLTEVNRIVAVINAGSPTLAAGLISYEVAVSRGLWEPIILGSGSTGRLDWQKKEFITPSGMLPGAGASLTNEQITRFV